ncbi:MAG: O-antigen ligase family protein [Pirellulales bacterium]|nr:O-antigen ligase family protein [Pirellulales bacterium]
MTNARLWIGFLLAFYMIVGRWSLARINDEFETNYYLQPRLWAVIALAAVVLIDQSSARWRKARRNPDRPRMGALTAAMIAYFVYLIITASWAPDSEMAEKKAFDQVLSAAVAGLVFLAFRGDNAESRRTEFWKGFAILAGLLALASLVGTQSERFRALGGGPNTFGRNMGLMVLSGLYLSRVYRTKILWSIWWLTAAVGVLLVLLSGSRGAMLSLAVSASVFQVIDRQPLSKKVVLFAAASLVGAAIVTQTEIGVRAQEMFVGRVLHLTVEQQHTSGRAEIWAESFRIGMESPIFGAGLNAVQAEIMRYPHNIFLEAFGEGGLVGLALLLLVLFLGGIRLVRIRRRLNTATVAAFVHTLVAAQFSGNMFDSRGVFLLLMLGIIPTSLQATVKKGKRATAGALQSPHVGSSLAGTVSAQAAWPIAARETLSAEAANRH